MIIYLYVYINQYKEHTDYNINCSYEQNDKLQIKNNNSKKVTLFLIKNIIYNKLN